MVSAYTTAGITAGLKGDLLLTNTKSRQIQFAATVKPSLTLMGGIGLGFKKANCYAEGSVSGTIDTTLKFPMSSLEESMTAKLTGGARLKIVAAGHNLTEKAYYEFPGIQLYPKTSKNSLFKIAKPSQYELNNAKPISRDYLISNKTRLKKVSSNKTSFIKTNLYPYNEPELISLGNGKVMLIWVDDNGQKSDLNRTSLMYSIYDGNSWSEAKEIDETGTYNDRADVYVYDGKAYILWSKANKEWTESMTLSQKLATLDLYYTVFDGESFTTPVKVNDDSNSIYEMNYSIAVADNKVLVTWTENSENDIFNESGTNSLYYKELTNNVAGEKTIVATNSEGFTEIDSGYIGTNKVIAYSYTNGSDSEQGTDIAINYNGSKNIISNESSNNYEIRIKDDKLYYLNNSKLVEYDIANKTSQDIIDGLNDYDILSNGDNKAIVSIKPKESGFDLQAKYYNSSDKTWGEWIDITNYNKYIRKYSLIMSDTGKITAALSLADMLDPGTKTDEAFGSATLLVTDLDSSFDLEIGKEVYYDYDEIVPNGKVNFNFDVRNNSKKQLDSIKVAILDQNDKELQSSNVTCNLKAGETKEIKYEYSLPSEIKYQPIKIKIPSEYDEINLDNNTVETAIGYTDVELKNVKTTYKDNKSKITADINNIGYSDAKGVKINVYKTNASGELLHTINVGDLKAGDSKSITYEIPESVSSNEDIEDAIYLEVISEDTEVTLENNFARVLFKSKPAKVSNISLVESDTSKVKFEWNKLENCTGYEVFKYNNTTKKYEKIATIEDKKTNSYADANLKVGTRYSYKIRSYKDIDGQRVYGDYSAEFKTNTKLISVENFKVLRRSSTSLVLSWDKASEADGYEIYRAPSEDATFVKVKTITDKNTLTNASTGLLSATSYYYKIRSYKQVDTVKIYSDYTLLKATCGPAKPTGIKTINATENAIRIGWNKVDKANGYEVFRSTSENGKYARVKTITDNNTTQSASPNLEEGKTYYYRVKAYLEVDGEKLYGDSVLLKTSTKSFGTITGLKMAANTENSIRISWNKVNNADGYEVFRSLSENGLYVKVKTIEDKATTTASSPNLQASTTYYYKVRAYKLVNGNKQYGDFSIVQTSTKPKAVNNLKSLDVTKNSIKIVWDEVSGASGYEVFRATSENGSYVKVGTTSNLDYTSKSVVSGKTYYYKVKAYRLIGATKTYGSYSNVLKVTVK